MADLGRTPTTHGARARQPERPWQDPRGWVRAATLITERIADGELKPGTRVLASDIENALDNVPVKEVWQALGHLGDNGTLARKWERGSRIYYVPGKPAAAADLDPLSLLDEEYISVEEVAAMLRVSKMTVYRLLNDGEIAAFRIGRSFRITRRGVAEYLRKNITQPGEIDIEDLEEERSGSTP